jgi:multimeric flavodoxin WrbA
MTAKIIGVSGSPRKGMSTSFFLKQCLQAAEETAGISTELIELADMNIQGCIACGTCTKEFSCSQEDDFQQFLSLFSDQNLAGLIVASPVYFGTMTSQTKAFLDRCVVFRRNGAMLRNKAGGALAVGGFRHGGQETTIHSIHSAFLIQDMVIVGDGNTTFHFGGTGWSGHPDGYEKDEFGIATVKNLGLRVAEVALKMQAPK